MVTLPFQTTELMKAFRQAKAAHTMYRQAPTFRACGVVSRSFKRQEYESESTDLGGGRVNTKVPGQNQGTKRVRIHNWGKSSRTADPLEFKTSTNKLSERKSGSLEAGVNGRVTGRGAERNARRGSLAWV